MKARCTVNRCGICGIATFRVSTEWDLNTARELASVLTFRGAGAVGSWFNCNPGAGTGDGCKRRRWLPQLSGSR